MENKNARAVLKPPSLFISSIHLTNIQTNNYSKSVQKCYLFDDATKVSQITKSKTNSDTANQNSTNAR